jgi:hypothetical protein
MKTAVAARSGATKASLSATARSLADSCHAKAQNSGKRSPRQEIAAVIAWAKQTDYSDVPALQRSQRELTPSDVFEAVRWADEQRLSQHRGSGAVLFRSDFPESALGHIVILESSYWGQNKSCSPRHVKQERTGNVDCWSR